MRVLDSAAGPARQAAPESRVCLARAARLVWTAPRAGLVSLRAAPLFPATTDPKESTMTHLTCGYAAATDMDMKLVNLSASEFDVVNARGYSVAWIARRDGGLRLMSTSAPLTDVERGQLAAKCGLLAGEAVAP